MKALGYADGGCKPNPGQAGSGAVLRDRDTNQMIAKICQYWSRATNNQAELLALILLLQKALELGVTDIEVRMDSMFVVESVKGNWVVKHPNVHELHKIAYNLSSQFERFSIKWIPREQNKEADALATAARYKGK